MKLVIEIDLRKLIIIPEGLGRILREVAREVGEADDGDMEETVEPLTNVNGELVGKYELWETE